MTKQQLQNTVTELQAALDKAKADLAKADSVGKVWVPARYDQYCYINSTGEVKHATYYRADCDSHPVTGNCFETEEQAERAAKRLRLMLWLEQQAIAHNEPGGTIECEVFFQKFNQRFDYCFGKTTPTVLPMFTLNAAKHVIDNMPNEIKQLWRELL